MVTPHIENFVPNTKYEIDLSANDTLVTVRGYFHEIVNSNKSIFAVFTRCKYGGDIVALAKPCQIVSAKRV